MNTAIRRLPRVAAALAIVGLALSGTGALAAYPDKPIKLVVGYPPGGAGDTVARLFAGPLSERLGQPVVVENRPGAGAVVAAQQVASAPADGYTIFFTGNSTLTINPYTFKSLPYDPRTSFTPLGMVAALPLVLLTTPDGPSTVAAFVDRARAEPQKWTFGSYGLGNAGHFAGELLNAEAKLAVVHVPHSGSSPNLTALIGGHIPMAVDTALASVPQVRAGKLKALATFSDKRLPSLPEVPTIAEAGYPGAAIESWLLFLAPAKLPADVEKRLSDALADAARQPAVVQKVLDANIVPVYQDGASVARRIDVELKQMKDITERAGIKPQ
ncbi:MAG: tripartite tricarboxylate transporter substrate binding protein [Burkholderiaceae bacterium]